MPFLDEDRRYGPLIGFYRAAARQTDRTKKTHNDDDDESGFIMKNLLSMSLILFDEWVVSVRSDTRN